MFDDVITRPSTSTQRYRRGEIPGQAHDAQRILDNLDRSRIRPRASRQAQLNEAIQATRSTNAYQMRANRNERHTDEDDEILLPTTRPQLQYQQSPRPRRQMHWSIYTCGGMCSVLLLLWVWIHLSAWWINVSDVSYYTQSAHRDTLIISTAQGQTEQIKGFVDAQNHIDALVIPDGNMSKIRVIQGPPLTNYKFENPQAAMLAAGVKNGQVYFDASDPVSVDMSFAWSHAQMRWSVPGVTTSSKEGK